MSTRLTKAQREEFVDEVMADVPQIDYEEKLRSVATKAVVASLPPAVRRIYDDEELRGYLEMQTPQISFPSPKRDPHDGYSRHGFSICVPYKNHTEAGKIAEAAVTALKAKWKAQDEKLAALRLRLATVAGSCTTRKALVEALPDFVKYMPPELEQPTANLPALATSVTQDFKAAGFPK